MLTPTVGTPGSPTISMLRTGVQIPTWSLEGSWAHNSPMEVFSPLEGDVDKEILKFAVNLSNHITTDKALANLKMCVRLPISRVDVEEDSLLGAYVSDQVAREACIAF